MCLLSKTCATSIANEDIECYKVLIKKDNRIITAYRRFPLGEEIIKGECDFVEKTEGYIDVPKRAALYHIGEGFIHTFKTLRSAIDDTNYHAILNKNCKIFVYKCIIPKGTSYLEGKFDDVKSYASRRVRFVEKIYETN